MTVAWWYRFFRQHVMRFGLLGGALIIATVGVAFTVHDEANRPVPWIVRVRDVLEIADAAFVVLGVGFIATFSLAARLIAPPGAVTADELLSFPARPPVRTRFRYRIPMSHLELRAAVMIADKEFGVVARHPTLLAPARYGMYTKWWDIQPEAFLILDRFSEQLGAWIPFALTIILPLTKAGEELILQGKMKLTELNASHIETSGSSSFLVEAWIMQKRNPFAALRNPLIRPAEQHFAKALLFMHLARFHDGTEEKPATVFVDMGVPRMKMIGQRLGFTGTYKSLDGAPFQRLTLPGSGVDDECSEAQAILYENVRKARTWPVFRESTEGSTYISS